VKENIDRKGCHVVILSLLFIFDNRMHPYPYSIVCGSTANKFAMGVKYGGL